MHDTRTEGCTEKAMDGAAAGGHLEMVQWLHKNRSEVRVCGGGRVRYAAFPFAAPRFFRLLGPRASTLASA